MPQEEDAEPQIMPYKYVLEGTLEHAGAGKKINLNKENQSIKWDGHN